MSIQKLQCIKVLIIELVPYPFRLFIAIVSENHEQEKDSLKINELIQSSEVGDCFFNSTLAKNTSVRVKKYFCISSNLSYKSMVEFLKLIYNFLTSGNTTRSTVYIFLVVSVRGVCSWPNR